MAFPIIPSGMFSGQGSTKRPNVGANGTISNVTSPTEKNLANAYDGDPNTFAEVQCTGVKQNGSQEVLYTHSPATGLLAGSFLYCNITIRANVYIAPVDQLFSPTVQLVATMTGNYSDTTPIISPANPYTILNCPVASIKAANPNGYSNAFTGTISLPFDQFAPLTIDLYSLSLSIKWSGGTDGGSATGGNSVFDARIYDISYIYL